MGNCRYQYNIDISDLLPINFSCSEERSQGSSFCIFHDRKRYLQHKRRAIQRFERKIRESIDRKEPLECIGFFIPSFDFIQLLTSEEKEKGFPQIVYFVNATFYEGANFSRAIFSNDAIFYQAKFAKEANFRGTKFCGKADFMSATFSEETKFVSTDFFKVAYFSDAAFCRKANFRGAKFREEAEFVKTRFTGETFFRYTLFEQQNKVKFDDNNLSNVSFAESDISRINFSDKVRWRGKDKFTIVEEEWLKNKVKGKKLSDEEDVSLDLVLSVYRNLRENYEFRLRYDEAGRFFIKEMELKRNYRHVSSKFDIGLITS